jgi:WD repeat-containing protein 53
MASKQPVIQSVKLKGHQGSVLCLDHSSSSCTGSSTSRHQQSSPTAASLLSGSEDGTCRVWDLRASCRASLCIKCPGEVLSVAFGPPPTTTRHHNASTLDPSPFAREYSVYTAVENNVYGYDLRNITSPIITDSSIDFSFLGAPDEINQIAFSPRRNLPTDRRKDSRNNSSVTYLAAADDSGTVRVTDSIGADNNGCSTLRRNKRVYCHGRDAMVTSLAFCPRSTNKQTCCLLASGGTDCCIQLWDIGNAKSKEQQQQLPLCSVSIPPTDAAANQICNPPMVHSLNWSPSGLLLAAGLGDGSVALLQQTGTSLVLTARLNDAHSGSLASCLFPEWTCTNNNNANSTAIAAHDRLFCTAGNDGCIVLWDLGVTVSGSDKAINPADILQLQSDDDVTPKLNGLRLSAATKIDADMDQPQTLFAFQHVAKPNWMVSSRGRDPVFPSSLFVADTSHDITAYTIPLQ